MTRRTRLTALAVASLIPIGTAACGDDSSTSATDPETSVTTSAPNTPPTEPTPSTGSTPSTPETPVTRPTEPTDPGESTPPTRPDPQGPDAAHVEAAKADLARRLDVDQTAITITDRQAVTWRDGSMGCPQPGTMYTQALVPGRRLILTVDGIDYAYHAGQQGDYFFCAKPAADPIAPGGLGSDT